MKIDVFLTWVDAADEEWIKRRREYEEKIGIDERDNINGIARYRDWENLKYVFRGIEKNMPWVNNVFFVTCGQIPSFLNTDHPRLRIIDHKDYIPSKYLPTFNSNTIEMNLFRIDELSEHFILFNDDTFPIDYIKQEYFFKNEMVCDEAIERVIGDIKLTYGCVMLNNAHIVNKYFDKRKVKRENFWKWYHPTYGEGVLRNIILNYFNVFEGLRNPHQPYAMRKSLFKHIWELEYEILDKASSNRLRDITDVSQYLVRYWNIFEGNFYPRKHKGKAWQVNDFNYKQIAEDIRGKKYPLICIDEATENFTCFFESKKIINAAFEEIFPDKSSFEV